MPVPAGRCFGFHWFWRKIVQNQSKVLQNARNWKHTKVSLTVLGRQKNATSAASLCSQEGYLGSKCSIAAVSTCSSHGQEADVTVHGTAKVGHVTSHHIVWSVTNSDKSWNTAIPQRLHHLPLLFLVQNKYTKSDFQFFGQKYIKQWVIALHFYINRP